MLPRAERLAEPLFFQNIQSFQNWTFAELPVAFNLQRQVLIDTQTHAHYCSCALFPKPCLHAQAFALLLQQPDPPTPEPASQLPEWASLLLSGRAVSQTDASRPSEPGKAQQEQRHLARLVRAENGFGDLEMWLSDTLHRGLATGLSEDPDFFKNIAARLADASMRGMSRNFRMLDPEQPDWAEQAATTLADAALALHAFRNRNQLPEALVFDLEAYIGISLKKEIVRTQGKSLRDVWLLAGSVEEPVEASLRLRRTWLLGQNSQRFALLLEYAHGGMDFQAGFSTGALLEGELIFYPSAFPLRALVAESLSNATGAASEIPGFDLLEKMATGYATAIGVQPWLLQFPVVLHQVRPYRQKEQFRLTDNAGNSIPLTNTGNSGWSLLALSAGREITVFSEWNGSSMLVISVLELSPTFRVVGI